MTTDTTSEFRHRYVGPTATEPKTARTTLLLLHGTGGDENDLIPLGQTLLPGIGLLSPRGKVMEGGAARFFRRLAEGVLDQEDLKFRTAELAGFVESAAVHYRFDQSGIIAVGFSNGANIAISLLFRFPELLRGAILLSPMLPFVPEKLPDFAGAPIFIGAGRDDPLVPVHQIDRLKELLIISGAEVTLHWEPGGHTVTQNELITAQNWLRQIAI